MTIFNATSQFLRRLTGATGYPAGLLAGQPFHNEVENVLYIGIGQNGTNAAGAILANSVLAIGGKGAFLDLASAQVITGKKTFNVLRPDRDRTGQLRGAGRRSLHRQRHRSDADGER